MRRQFGSKLSGILALGTGLICLAIVGGSLLSGEWLWNLASDKLYIVAELPRARERWAASEIKDFDIHIDIRGHAPCIADATLFVRDNHVAEFEPDQDFGKDQEGFKDYLATFCNFDDWIPPRVFDKVELSPHPDLVDYRVRIMFEPTYGYVSEYVLTPICFHCVPRKEVRLSDFKPISR